MTSCFLGEHSRRGGRAHRSVSSQCAGTTRIPRRCSRSGRDRWLAGSVDDVAERIDELRELGVTRVFLQHLNHSDDEMVALIGERLLPALR